MRGLILGIGALAAVGAIAYAASASKNDTKKLTVVWDGQRWVYAEVRPDGIYPTNIPAPPIQRYQG